jgi:hypothetical protein
MEQSTVRKRSSIVSSPQARATSLRPVLAWFVPYERRVIHTPLAIETVRVQLAAAIEQLTMPSRRSFFSTAARYEGEIEQDRLTLSGPHANRRFSLRTHGILQSDLTGTQIDLTLQLSTGHALLVVLQHAFLWGWVLLVGFPVVLALPMSVLIYIITMFSCHSEARQIVGILLRAAGPPPAAEAQGAIVPDGVGWRCGSCGGYVRQDATFCKHCKRPFSQ